MMGTKLMEMVVVLLANLSQEVLVISHLILTHVIYVVTLDEEELRCVMMGTQ